MAIRPATEHDRDAIWVILRPMIRRGETHTLPRDMSEEQALTYWLSADKETFVWDEGGVVLGTYYLKANQEGGGGRVANCGYVTSEAAQGRGIARAMCVHLLERAGNEVSARCNSTSSSAPTRALLNCGPTWALKLSGDYRWRLNILN